MPTAWKQQATCWRVKETEALCDGIREDIQGVVLALPVFFAIEVGDDLSWVGNPSAEAPVWSFPLTLQPLTKTLAKKHGLVYNLVGLAMLSASRNHFISRYASSDLADIFTYDGMRFGGFSRKEEQGTPATHLAGKSPKLPEGYTAYLAVYHLEGGSAAQDVFFQERVKKCKKLYNLEVSSASLSSLPTVSYLGAGMKELEPQKRNWLRRPAISTGTREYVTRKPGILDTDITSSDSESPSPPTPPLEPDNNNGSPVIAKIKIEPTKSPILPGLIADTIHGKEESPSSSASSRPDSPFILGCRCGRSGDGNILYEADEGVAVQCDSCKRWSHMACQRDGCASLLKPKDPFECHLCNLEELMPVNEKRRVSQRKYVPLQYICTAILIVRCR